MKLLLSILLPLLCGFILADARPVQVLFPAAGDHLKVGNTYTISWSRTGGDVQFAVYLSLDSGMTRYSIGACGGGTVGSDCPTETTLTWMVPDSIGDLGNKGSVVSGNCIIFIKDPYLTGTNETFSEIFSIDSAGSTSISMNLQKQAPGFRVFPNPARSEIRIQLDGGSPVPFRLSLFNLSGALVKQLNGETNGSLNLRDFPEGVYFIKTTNASNPVVRKLLIIR